MTGLLTVFFVKYSSLNKYYTYLILDGLDLESYYLVNFLHLLVRTNSRKLKIRDIMSWLEISHQRFETLCHRVSTIDSLITSSTHVLIS